MYHRAAQQGYIHDTDSHTKSTGNCGENKFSRANPKREVKILTICLSNLATKNPEEKRFWKEEQSPRLRQKRVICGWKEASVSLLCISKIILHLPDLFSDTAL